MQQLKMAASEIVESQILICLYSPNSDKQYEYVYQIEGNIDYDLVALMKKFCGIIIRKLCNN